MLTHAGIRIDTGTASVFSDYPNGEMWTGNGPRKKTVHVPFPDGPFKQPPLVTVSISGIDAGNQANLRASASVAATSEHGFTAQVDTWADSKLAMVTLGWLAIGE